MTKKEKKKGTKHDYEKNARTLILLTSNYQNKRSKQLGLSWSDYRFAICSNRRLTEPGKIMRAQDIFKSNKNKPLLLKYDDPLFPVLYPPMTYNKFEYARKRLLASEIIKKHVTYKTETKTYKKNNKTITKTYQKDRETFYYVPDEIEKEIGAALHRETIHTLIDIAPNFCLLEIERFIMKALSYVYPIDKNKQIPEGSILYPQKTFHIKLFHSEIDALKNLRHVKIKEKRKKDK
jgi:hypothetical protein